ncbi:MAG: CsbD family protein [Isosphaeraceae bacterium]
MKWYEIASDWKRFTGLVKEKWSKLTDADLTTFGGKSDQLAVLLQQKYGYPREQADKEIEEFALWRGRKP